MDSMTRLTVILCAAVPVLSLYLQQVQDRHPVFTIIGVAAIIAVAAGLGRVISTRRDNPDAKDNLNDTTT